MGLDPLQRSRTAEQVASVLRRRIADGLLEPGLWLKEDELSTALGVSRNTVREAFQLLVHEGMVVRAQHRGAFVREMSIDDVSDIFRTRRLMEPLGIGPSARDKVLAGALLDIVDSAAVAAEHGRWREVGTANLDLHRALVRSCRSARLDRMSGQLFAELRLAFLMTGDAQALHEPYLEWNRRIAELTLAGDVDSAESELASYLADSERTVIAGMSG